MATPQGTLPGRPLGYLIAPLAAPLVFWASATIAEGGRVRFEELMLFLLVGAPIAYMLAIPASITLGLALWSLDLLRPIPVTLAAGIVGVGFMYWLGSNGSEEMFAAAFVTGAVPGYIHYRLSLAPKSTPTKSPAR